MFKWLGILVMGAAVFGISYHYNKRFLDWLRFQSIGTRDYIVEKLSMMFVEVQPQWILIGQFVISFGFGSLIFLLLLPQIIPGIMLGLLATFLGWKAPKPIVDWLYKRRVRKFVLQMVDGLGLMSNGMRSGLSIAQALNLVVQEMDDPIRQEFNLILNENKLGVPLEEAFTNLSKRIESDDVEMFVTAVNILKETGGNLAETFDIIVTTIRERVKLEKRIEALTAQGFYQGVFLLGLAPALGFMIYQSDPEFMKPLFSTTLGWIILVVVAMMLAFALFLILRIVKIEV